LRSLFPLRAPRFSNPLFSLFSRKSPFHGQRSAWALITSPQTVHMFVSAFPLSIILFSSLPLLLPHTFLEKSLGRWNTRRFRWGLPRPKSLLGELFHPCLGFESPYASSYRLKRHSPNPPDLPPSSPSSGTHPNPVWC